MERTKCLVVLSGGLDSTVALFLAKERFVEVVAVVFDYGQRSAKQELASAKAVADLAGVDISIIKVPNVLSGSSPLIKKTEPVPVYESERAMAPGVDPTFVPGRNILFLSIAGSLAVNEGIRDIVTGICSTGFNGYPDCRPTFLEMMQRALTFGLLDDPHDTPMVLHTPFLFKSKKDIIIQAIQLEGCMAALAVSTTCYSGTFPPCGGAGNKLCHACLTRAVGFRDAGIPDPLIMRAINEGKLPSDYPPTGYIAAPVPALPGPDTTPVT